MNKVRFQFLGSLLVLLSFCGGNINGMKNIQNMQNTRIAQKAHQIQKEIPTKSKQKTRNIQNINVNKTPKQSQQLTAKSGNSVSNVLNISKNIETNNKKLISDVKNVPDNDESLSQYETLQTSKWLGSLLAMVKKDIKKFGNLKCAKEYFESTIEDGIDLLVDKKNCFYETWKDYFENVNVVFDNHSENKIIINFSEGKGVVKNAKFVVYIYYDALKSCSLECVSAS